MVKNILLCVGCRKSPRMEVCETGTDRASSTSQLPKIAVGQKCTHKLHVTLLFLWRVSFSFQHSNPELPCPSPSPKRCSYPSSLPLPASIQQALRTSPAELYLAGLWLQLAMLLGPPHCFWARIWLIFLGKHSRPGNSFWQLVPCLWSVHLCCWESYVVLGEGTVGDWLSYDFADRN